jgi:hypothetical protein
LDGGTENPLSSTSRRDGSGLLRGGWPSHSLQKVFHYFFGVTADGGDGLTGSVSVGVWQMACKRVIHLGERVVKDLTSTFQVSRNNLAFNSYSIIRVFAFGA